MMSRLFVFLIAIVASACVLLSSCGFQLRKELQLPQPYQQVFIHSSQANNIQHLLKKKLQNNHIPMINEFEKDNEQLLIVNINNEKINQRILAIRNQEVKAYDITMQVGLSVRNTSGKVLLKQQLRASQQISYNDQQVLSSVNEENIIHHDLREIISSKIMFLLRGL